MHKGWVSVSRVLEFKKMQQIIRDLKACKILDYIQAALADSNIVILSEDRTQLKKIGGSEELVDQLGKNRKGYVFYYISPLWFICHYASLRWVYVCL